MRFAPTNPFKAAAELPRNREHFFMIHPHHAMELDWPPGQWPKIRGKDISVRGFLRRLDRWKRTGDDTHPREWGLSIDAAKACLMASFYLPPHGPDPT